MAEVRATSTASALALAAGLLAAGSLAGCRSAPSAERTVLEGRAMGTSFRVQVAARLDAADTERVEEAIARVLREVDERMSTWRDDSEIQALNRAEAGELVPVSPETLQLLALAADLGRRSEGAFDITVGALVEAWGFGPAGEPEQLPDAARVAELLAAAGWERLELDFEGLAVRKASRDLRCDLSAIAKGDGVDRIALALEELGLHRYLVEIGGELRAAGAAPGGGAWRVAIERPDGSGGIGEHVVALQDAALATSGDYRRSYERAGRRLSHALDPRTGRPIEHATASVVVRHERCAIADAWATALLVLGDEEGRRVATEQGIAALFLVRDGRGGFEARQSPRWD